jgi:hypothetical protein
MPAMIGEYYFNKLTNLAMSRLSIASELRYKNIPIKEMLYYFYISIWRNYGHSYGIKIYKKIHIKL